MILLRRVFRLGLIEVRQGGLRIRNRTFDRTMLWLSDAERERWLAWLRAQP